MALPTFHLRVDLGISAAKSFPRAWPQTNRRFLFLLLNQIRHEGYAEFYADFESEHRFQFPLI